MNYQKNIGLPLHAISKMMPGVFLWKKNLDSAYTEINQDCSKLFGLIKNKDILGLTDDEIPCNISRFANEFKKQDMEVISTGKPLKILEMHICSQNEWKVMLNTKNPLVSEDNSIVGTFAYCIDITNQLFQIQNFLSLLDDKRSLKKDKLINGSYIIHDKNSDVGLTSRQMDCLFYLLRGKTSKEIAVILKLSTRTIEYYLAKIKEKFSCNTKSELIDFAISKGFMNVIPNCLYNKLGPKSITF